MSENPLIYTISTIRSFLAGGCRVVGYSHDFDKAEEWVKDNVMDINEDGYYPFVVIEPMPEGIYVHPEKEFWYRYCEGSDTYESCDKPDRYKHTIAWSMG